MTDQNLQPAVSSMSNVHILMAYIVITLLFIFITWLFTNIPRKHYASNLQEREPTMSGRRNQLAVPNSIYALILFVGSIIFQAGIWLLAKQRGIDTPDLFLDLGHLTILIVFLLYTPSTLHRGVEWIGWILLGFTEWFYYETKLNAALQSLGAIAPGVKGAADKVILFQHQLWKLIMELGPDKWPYNVGVSFWPIYILGLGLLLRAGIYKWGGARLMVHARAYWLWITLYLTMLLVLASVSPWSFYFLLVVTLAVATVLLAGASQVASDIFMLTSGYLRAGCQVLNVLCRWIVYYAILLTDRIRRIIRRIREWYQHYVTEPLRRAVDRIDIIVEGWKDHIVKKTDELDRKSEDL